MSLTSASLLGGERIRRLRRTTCKACNDPLVLERRFCFTLKYTLCITPILMGLGFLLALLTADEHAA